MRALLSVYDKTGLVEFAARLAQAGFELISTGGTHGALTREGGLPVRQVSEVTGSPEILEGRVKTLHPVIHGGLLARRDDPDHMSQLADHRIEPIDIAVVNLYPFVQTISKAGVTLAEALENIDIGGPTILRAAAKNFPAVTVVVDPSDYSWVADKTIDGSLTAEDRRGLAAKAFRHVSEYDTAVAAYLAGEPPDTAELPVNLSISLTRTASLRYGENPHQRGALYSPAHAPAHGLAAARQLHGRELSYNNLMDADAVWRTVSDFDDSTVAVVKHGNPCGLASRDDQAEAYRLAYEGDSVSAFGGIVGYNRPVTLAAAQAMGPVFYEVIIAPGYEPDALETLKKKRNLRILVVDQGSGPAGYDLRPVSGGLLVQDPDDLSEDPSSLEDGHQPGADQRRTPGPGLCLEGRQAHQVQRHRLCQGPRLGRHGRRPAQPGRQRPPVPAYRRRQGPGQRPGLRRLLPLSR